MTYVGIDVSKATFVVAYSSAKTSKTKTFKNRKGIHGVRPNHFEHHCVLEAAGNYSALLVYLLSEAEYHRQSGESSEDKKTSHVSCSCHQDESGRD